jgi:hypothetical protein
MLAVGSQRGAWSQNVDCDIFSLHYTLFQSIKNAQNNMKKIRQTNFSTHLQRQRPHRCTLNYAYVKRNLLTPDSVGAPTL